MSAEATRARFDSGSRESCDLLVIGAGPAGIAAACVAAESGLSVTVLDLGELPGGQIWRGPAPDAVGASWRQRFERSTARYLSRSAAIDIQRDVSGLVATVARPGAALLVRATNVLLATGARELLLPFPGWTLPNVVGAGGAQALLKSGMDVAGKRVVVAGTGPLIVAVAAALRHAGADVLRTLEQASLANVARFSAATLRSPYLVRQAAQLGVQSGMTRYRTGSWVVAAHGADVLRAVTIREGLRGAERTLDCDLLCHGMGLIPNLELARLLGCDLMPGVGGGVVTDADQRTSVENVFAAGEIAGVGGAPLAIAEGMIAAHAVTGRPLPRMLMRRRLAARAIAAQMRRSFEPRAELRELAAADTLVCRCEDVPYAAVASLQSLRAAKLYTRCGMGPCQGRVCGAALQFLRGWEPDTVRVPAQPAAVSILTSAH